MLPAKRLIKGGRRTRAHFLTKQHELAKPADAAFRGFLATGSGRQGVMV